MPLSSIFKKVGHFDSNDLRMLERAYIIADRFHTGQKRKAGEAYIKHPLRVAETLASLNMDSETMAAGLLHEAEGKAADYGSKVGRELGKDIGGLMDGITKVRQVEHQCADQQYQALNLVKILHAISGDVRVALLRLADRFDNMQTLWVHPEEDRKRIALETLEVYAPLAGRLGVGLLKGELEDLSFQYLYPQKYEWIKQLVEDKLEQKEEEFWTMKTEISRILKKEGIQMLEMDFRPKHLWSLHKKLERYEMNMGKIYDLAVYRIIIPSISQCYQALGIINKSYKMLPGMIKDYIALPKPNGYQSLHTVVFNQQGNIIELQIRTLAMHRKAEIGVASRWVHPQKGDDGDFDSDKILEVWKKEIGWTFQFKEGQVEKEDAVSQDLLDSLKTDYFESRVFVFTPKGERVSLPEGSSVIDFAFTISVQTGKSVHSAKVNNISRPLSFQLKSGDIVEVFCGKQKKFGRNLINCAKTYVARKHLRLL